MRIALGGAATSGSAAGDRHPGGAGGRGLPGASDRGEKVELLGKHLGTATLPAHRHRRRPCPIGSSRYLPGPRPSPRRNPVRPDHAHDVLVGVAPAPSHQRRAAGLGQRRREGHQRPRQVPDAAQASVGAPGHLRRRPRRPGRPFVRDRELHAGAAHPAADAGAARRRRHGRGQLGRLLAHLLEALPQGRRVQGREAARRVHARPGPDVHQEADQRHRRHPGDEDPHRRRHRRGGRRRRWAPPRSSSRRRSPTSCSSRGVADGVFFPHGVDRLVQARHRDQAGHAVPRRHVQLGVRLLHERGQVGQAVQGRTRTRSTSSRGEHLARFAGQSWDEADQRAWRR